MTTLNAQIAQTPNFNGYPCVNQQSSDIAAGLAVIVDSTNAIAAGNFDTDFVVAVKLPGSDGDVAIGVTQEILKANGVRNGNVVLRGPTVQMTASGSITAGGYVMCESATGKAKAQTSTDGSIGIALTTAADGEVVLVMLDGCRT